MTETVPYRTLSSYLKEKYGEPVGKICIDGGFTCPNRDGTAGVGGCIFCGERGAGEHIAGNRTVEEQIAAHFSRPHKEKKFIAYFQNFTNTYAPLGVLRARYGAALTNPAVVALAVGTRPDCIDEGVAALLASFREKTDVWVELGLQTANDKTAALCNRGYGTEVFDRAVKILRAYGIPTVVHLMFGLPGEDENDFRDTVAHVAAAEPFGVKIHSVYVMKNTALADMYLRGEYTPIGEETYLRAVADALTRLPETTVVHRLTGDCPTGELLAPVWGRTKSEFLTDLRRYMCEHSLRQGVFYKRTQKD